MEAFVDYIVDLFRKGGITMWPLALCSLTAVTFFFERALALRARKVVDPEEVERFATLIRRRELGAVRGLCSAGATPLQRILSAALDSLEVDVQEARAALLDAGRREAARLEHYLEVLGTNAQVAPLLGLLGTVLGMMQIFVTVGAVGLSGDPQSLAGGIAQALITTVTGLCIGIPSLVAFNFFQRRADTLGAMLEGDSLELLALAARSAAAGGPAVGPATSGAGD